MVDLRMNTMGVKLIRKHRARHVGLLGVSVLQRQLGIGWSAGRRAGGDSGSAYCPRAWVHTPAQNGPDPSYHLSPSTLNCFLDPGQQSYSENRGTRAGGSSVVL